MSHKNIENNKFKNSNINLVFIGMPGCGKTTIGRILAEKLHKSFFDVDEYIEKTTGRLIKEIFLDGEEAFRKIERKAVLELSKSTSSVISTGGGAVKDVNNIISLKENGIIFFIDRPLEDIINDLETKDRPLLKEGKHKVYKLYEERYNLYKEYCDFHIRNTETIEATVKKIIDAFNSSHHFLNKSIENDSQLYNERK